MTQQTLTAWLEIPVSDLEAAVTYYDTVFGWSSRIVTNMGPNPIAVLNGLDEAAGAHLYQGKPGNGVGSTVHLTVTDTVEAAAGRTTEAGGQVIGPIVGIPSGRFQYTLDPDGNSIGLFEPKAAA